MLGSTGNAVSYESVMGFGVANPTFLRGLEGMQSVQSDAVKEGMRCSAEIGKRYKKAKRAKMGWRKLMVMLQFHLSR
jgi:hypothetical protein